jgi:hypothetical protein
MIPAVVLLQIILFSFRCGVQKSLIVPPRVHWWSHRECERPYLFLFYFALRRGPAAPVKGACCGEGSRGGGRLGCHWQARKNWVGLGPGALSEKPPGALAEKGGICWEIWQWAKLCIHSPKSWKGLQGYADNAVKKKAFLVHIPVFWFSVQSAYDC